MSSPKESEASLLRAGAVWKGRNLGMSPLKESEASLLRTGVVWKGGGEAALGADSQMQPKECAVAPKTARSANGQQRTKGRLWCLSIDTYSASLPWLGGESYSRWRVGNNFHSAWHCFSIASCSSGAIHATGTFAGKI